MGDSFSELYSLLYLLISNKTRWNNCFLKNARKISRIIPVFLSKQSTDFQVVFSFEQTRYSYHIWRAWYNGSYTMMAKPIRALEFHYAMIQFLIIYNTFIFTVEEERRSAVYVKHSIYLFC